MSASKNLGDIEARKGDHIRYCLEHESTLEASVFDKHTLPYNALPEFSMEEVDTTYRLHDHILEAPIIIASMTGGSEHGREINKNLAIAAGHCGVAMGLGSQRIGLEKPDARDTFELVRKYAPKAFLFANMGAVQLNYGHTVESYKRIIDMIEANALYLHLNPLQEALQPGGDTDFSNLLSKIEALVREVQVPVFVKEVGHGISKDVAERLISVGVSGIDVAGVGGTSYAWVEAKRSGNSDFAKWFQDFGIPTDLAVQEVASLKTEATIVASGGIRSPIDGLKARNLGADMFSCAVPFLEPAMNSSEEIIETIENWKQGLKIAMFASGLKRWQ